MSEHPTPDNELARTLVVQSEIVDPDKSHVDVGRAPDFEVRYALGARLGEGGMGEVWAARDGVIGRDVAMKSIRSSLEGDSVLRARFLREARVQAQLEHPSIVPVHDLALDPRGRVFFTMQRVRGRTLDAVVAGRDAPTRHALLTAFGRVALAVDFAHAHGVVHRDLKPSNLMIGDYGEVYVLDWGLAKLHDRADPLEPAGAADARRAPASPMPAGTQQGSMLGTPGFMPPEQIRGLDVDERADVYALGSSLFELLAGEPLHGGATQDEVLEATLRGADARFSRRVPERDVPPELEAICVNATAARPEDRFPSARAMVEALDGFLAGDRDVARRRELATDHARTADALATRAIDEGDEQARAGAMREVGRALAFDPEQTAAMRTLVRILTAPPRKLPPEVAAEIDAERDQQIGTARRGAAVGILSTVVPIGFQLWMGIREAAWLLAGVVCALVSIALTLGWSGPERKPTSRRYLVALTTVAGLVAGSRVAGPFVVLPVLALGLAVGLTLFPRRIPVAVAIAAGWASVLVPLVLELTGVLPPSHEFAADRLCIIPRLTSLPQTPTLFYLVCVTLLPIAAVCIYLARLRDRLAAAELALRVQAWHLRQIVPAAAP